MDTTSIRTKYKKAKRYPETSGELPLTGILLSKDAKIRGAITRIAKTNAILKRPVNKLFPIENTYQDTNQTGMTRQQKLRREAVVIGELNRKYEC